MQSDTTGDLKNRKKDSVVSISSIYPEPLFLRDKEENLLFSSFQHRGSHQASVMMTKNYNHIGDTINMQFCTLNSVLSVNS